MNRIIDRLLILGCCLLSLAGGSHNTAAVVALLAAVTVSSLNGLTDSRSFVRASTLLYALLTLFFPGLLFFFPLILYDLFLNGRRDGEKPVLILVAAVLVVAGLGLPPGTVLSLGLFTAVAHVLAKRTRSVRDSDGQLRRVQDQSREITLQLQGKNEELIARRDQAAHLARLAERGRIAREIHDHVGHLLSRSILQIGALLVAVEEGPTRRGLLRLRDTLSEAMDRIRTSVHDLYKDSVDFQAQLEQLVQQFTFCPVHLDYRLEEDPGREIEHCFTAVVKEGLNNVARHSSASRVMITVREHPALYQLVLQDNGANVPVRAEKGLGLVSIADRVQALGGRFFIEREGGFRLFISIPKGGASPESAAN